MGNLFKDRTPQEHQKSLASFVPPGDAFAAAQNPDTNLGGLITGLSAELQRVYDDMNNISNDYDLFVTTELLSRWEKALGIPDTIFPGNGDLPTRRLHALIKFAKMNVQTAQQMATLVISLGFQNVDIQPLNALAFPPYTPPFFPAEPPDSRYIITIFATGIFLAVPPYDVPFTPASNTGGVMNLIMQLVKPTNVEILFRTPEATTVTPLTVMGTDVWLDSGDGSTISLGTANIVTAWNDKVGVSNATGASIQPTFFSTEDNGWGLMRFKGAQTLKITAPAMLNILNGDYTMFVVAAQSTTADVEYLLSWTSGSTTQGFIRYNADLTIASGQTPVTSVVTAGAGLQILRSRRSGTTQGIALNGVEVTNTSAANPSLTTDAAWIGSLHGTSGFYKGDITEIVLFNRHLNDSECLNFETEYLKPKWNM